MDYAVHNTLEHRLSFADKCMANDFGDDNNYPYDFAGYELNDVWMSESGNFSTTKKVRETSASALWTTKLTASSIGPRPLRDSGLLACCEGKLSQWDNCSGESC